MSHYQRWRRTGIIGGSYIREPGLSPEERFWRYVDKNGPDAGHRLGKCWLWTIGTQFRIGNRRLTARDASWEFAYPEVPHDGIYVFHKCTESMCVRPSHLYLTNRVYAKLTASAVSEIRSLYARKEQTMASLATQFSVSEATIHKAIHRKSWVDVL